MTTVTIIFFACLLIYTVINILLWLLEVIGAFVKCLVCYVINKPHDFIRSYVDIRILFTHFLLKVSYALLSPTQIMKYRNHIKAREQAKLIRKRNKYDHKLKLINHRH